MTTSSVLIHLWRCSSWGRRRLASQIQVLCQTHSSKTKALWFSDRYEKGNNSLPFFWWFCLQDALRPAWSLRVQSLKNKTMEGILERLLGMIALRALPSLLVYAYKTISQCMHACQAKGGVHWLTCYSNKNCSQIFCPWNKHHTFEDTSQKKNASVRTHDDKNILDDPHYKGKDPLTHSSTGE